MIATDGTHWRCEAKEVRHTTSQNVCAARGRVGVATVRAMACGRNKADASNDSRVSGAPLETPETRSSKVERKVHLRRIGGGKEGRRHARASAMAEGYT